MRRNTNVWDQALCAALFLGTLGYFGVLWPRDLNAYDEGLFLYEAKRILGGEVMYRDFFDLVAPAAWYLMALLYALFGVTMDTARMTMAVVHGLICVLVYVNCRLLSFRRTLALVAALADPALCYSFYSVASPHWFETFLILLLMYLVLRRPARTAARPLGMGILIGVLLLTHQTAFPVSVAAALMLLIDTWSAPRLAQGWGALAAWLAWYVVGIGLVVVPALAGLVALAGWEPVFTAFVRQAMRYSRYHAGTPVGFGLPEISVDLASRVRLVFIFFPLLLLKYGPLVVPLAMVRALWQWWTLVSFTERRPLLVALVFATGALLSVLYYPGTSHLAFTGPIWLILVAEAVHAASLRAATWPRMRYLPTGVALLLLFGVVVQLSRGIRGEAKKYSVRHPTAFGVVDFRDAYETRLIDALTSIFKAADAREVFVYPAYPSVYLLTETSNPTRFQVLLPEYNAPEQFEEVLSTLERRKVPFVVRGLWWWAGNDPLSPYLNQHYEPVALPPAKPRLPFLSLYRRKETTAAPTL